MAFRSWGADVPGGDAVCACAGTAPNTTLSVAARRRAPPLLRTGAKRLGAAMEQGMPGHLLGLRQMHQLQDGRCHIAELAIGELAYRSRPVDQDERHLVQRMRGMRLAGLRIDH